MEEERGKNSVKVNHTKIRKKQMKTEEMIFKLSKKKFPNN